ncbi:Cytochrome c oxidase subunit 6B [Actinomortierella ambigua]|nr:Cytochrome c oxidase subunit 6B [Actinomortierella ambigua]
MSDIKLETAGFDARFPNTNQTKHCWQAYVDFHKCEDIRGEGAEVCQGFKRVFNSICPVSYVAQWDEQRAEGTFPSNKMIKAHQKAHH